LDFSFDSWRCEEEEEVVKEKLEVVMKEEVVV